MKWIVLALWVFFSSGYLYLLNFAIPEAASLVGYFLFSVMLIGGGLSYDIASKMFSIPSHYEHWTTLLKQMGLVVLGFTLVIAGIFIAGYLSNLVNVAISSSFGFLISLLGIILACYYAYKTEVTFQNLRGD